MEGIQRSSDATTWEEYDTIREPDAVFIRPTDSSKLQGYAVSPDVECKFSVDETWSSGLVLSHKERSVMEFKDVEVGKTYSVSGGMNRKVVFRGSNYILAEIEGYEYPTTYLSQPNPCKNWVKEKVKVYVFSYSLKSFPKLIYTSAFNSKKQAYDKLVDFDASPAISWHSEVQEVTYEKEPAKLDNAIGLRDV